MIMLCNSVRAVFVGVLFTLPSVGWKFFLQATQINPNSEKIFTNRQVLKKAEIPNSSSSNGFDLNAMTMTKLSAGFTATLCRTSILF